MFKIASITIVIDVNKRDLFHETLKKFKISLDIGEGRCPKVIGSYYENLRIVPCRYYLKSSDNFEIFLEKSTINDPFENYILINKFINDYLNNFKELEMIKDFFILGTHLMLIFTGEIKHDDIIDFTMDTIGHISRLGLGISYNHV